MSNDAPSPLTVALIGNPNTGKSSLFNALAGVRQRVGNYPGVTVEKKVGRFEVEKKRFEIIDLPGTYSLAPRSPDEMVAVDVLLGRQSDVAPPDIILCILDASNLERNLYLVSQVLELGRPTILVLNMIDIAEKRGLKIDLQKFSRQLNLTVLPVQANKKIGIEELKRALVSASADQRPIPESPFPPEFCREVQRLEEGNKGQPSGEIPRYLIERLLLDTSGYLEKDERLKLSGDLHAKVQAARERLAQSGFPVPAVEALARYNWVALVLDGVIERPAERPATTSDRLDRILTHKIWGTLVFVAIMVTMFQAVFSWARPLMEGINAVKDSLAGWVDRDAILPDGALRSLLVNGVIQGVGSVVTFVPQIFFLFFFIAILEDCGYMARAAYLMDRLMVRVGLSGKSFIPLLSSFACAVPGIMATRTIENRRDRLITILVAPLMTCSARLPIYMLLIGAFIPPISVLKFQPNFLPQWLGIDLTIQALTMLGLFLLGIVTAMGVAFILRRTALQGETPPFVMELPNYKRPSATLVLRRMLEQSWSFIRNAGTVILAVAIIVWAASYYPHDSAAVDAKFGKQRDAIEQQLAKPADGLDSETIHRLQAQQTDLENQIAAEYQRNSYLGRAGRIIEPVVKPLGWDWRIGCAVIASFPAREVVIATLGVIYNLGKDSDADADANESEDANRLQQGLKSAHWEGTNVPVFNIPVAMSIMVFFALCAQCASTLAVIRRETSSWRWPIFTFCYMTSLAYVGAWIAYRIGMFFAG